MRAAILFRRRVRRPSTEDACSLLVAAIALDGGVSTCALNLGRFLTTLSGRSGRICWVFGLPLNSLSFYDVRTTLCTQVVYSVSELFSDGFENFTPCGHTAQRAMSAYNQ